MILLDTHVAVWLLLDSERISNRAADSIRHARRQGEGLALSCVSLYEIAVLAKRRRIAIQVSIELFLESVAQRLVIKPLTAHIAGIAMELSADYLADPMDRIIGATALAEHLPLITADDRIHRAKAFETIW